jgi:hypothetical protein
MKSFALIGRLLIQPEAGNRVVFGVSSIFYDFDITGTVL